MGIEPTRPAWKAGILPLNYTRMMCFPLSLTTIALYQIGRYLSSVLLKKYFLIFLLPI